MVLNEEYISALRTDHGFSCFYPTAKSKEETGARRGSVVLARSDRSGLMAQIESLRQIANESLTTILPDQIFQETHIRIICCSEKSSNFPGANRRAGAAGSYGITNSAQ
jgi:hypothetical protein